MVTTNICVSCAFLDCDTVLLTDRTARRVVAGVGSRSLGVAVSIKSNVPPYHNPWMSINERRRNPETHIRADIALCSSAPM